MIDFTNCKKIASTYGGSEKKKKIIYKGDIYLLKFPDPVREKGNSLSYMNNQYSEYIGCHIFESCGVKVQETILGKYIENDKEKIVVACKDFTTPKVELIEFTKLANSVTKTDQDFTCSIEDIYSVIENSDITNKEEIINSFWDMFVVDTIIGNPDRHLDNWGLLYDNETETYHFSPVYDCGSSLNALLSDEKKEALLSNKADFKNITYNAISANSMNHKKINYSEIYKNPPKDLEKALLRVAPRIDMNKINDIINSVPCINEVNKQFFKESIKIRKELIIDKAYEKIIKEQTTKAADKDIADDLDDKDI